MLVPPAFSELSSTFYNSSPSFHSPESPPGRGHEPSGGFHHAAAQPGVWGLSWAPPVPCPQPGWVAVSPTATMPSPGGAVLCVAKLKLRGKETTAWGAVTQSWGLCSIWLSPALLSQPGEMPAPPALCPLPFAMRNRSAKSQYLRNGNRAQKQPKPLKASGVAGVPQDQKHLCGPLSRSESSGGQGGS